MARPLFKRVEELFHQAVALDTVEQAAFLDEACGEDIELRAAVEELLRHDRADDSTGVEFVSPVAAEAAQYRPDVPTLPLPGLVGLPTPGARLPDVPGYELLTELGRGGMGVVYKARQTRLGRVVALKMLLAQYPVTAEQLARFRTEAETLARLNHPNVVAIYDIGEHDGRPYFALEYVAGPSLAQWLAGRPQEAHAAAHLLEVVARAVQAVHECGIIHRDLKPANILLQRKSADYADYTDKKQGTSLPVKSAASAASADEFIPKITDFGLAKDQAIARKLTAVGTAMGTPSYMAPEQARTTGEAIGPATDIYALGGILYEMLTGRPPFDAGSPAETITQLLNDVPISPARLRPRLPRDLVTICLKCLEKSPHRRYRSALDMAEDLRRFQAGEPIRARPVGPAERAYRWCRRRPLVTGLLTLSSLLAIAFVVTVLVYNALLREALAKAEGDVETEREELVHLNVEIGIVVLEGGDQFAALLRFTEALRLDQGEPGQERNHRTRIGTTLRQCPRLLRLETLDDASRSETRMVWDAAAVRLGNGPLFSSDGGLVLARLDGGEIRVCETATGRALTPPLRHGGRPVWAGFNGSGSRVVTVSDTGLASVWELPRHPRPQSAPKSDGAWAGPLCWSGPAVARAVRSPDGLRTLVCDDATTVHIRDSHSGAVLAPRLRHQAPLRYAAWSADGKRVVTADDATARVWDAGTGQLLAPALRPELPIARVYFSAGGDRACVAHEGGGVTTWDLSPDSRPVAELIALAQVLAAARVDANQVCQPLGVEGLCSAWKRVEAAQGR
jgi:serine/threonine protein kinase